MAATGPRRSNRKSQTSHATSVEPHPNSSAFPVRAEGLTAILIDGGFYRKKASTLFGEKTPAERADEVLEYSRRHIRKARSQLYRIFYYDCPPSEKVVYNPLTKKQVNLGKTDEYAWMTQFHKELTKRRKVALRRGEPLESQGSYQLKKDVLKRLLSGTTSLDDLTEGDLVLEITQKGVDMRMGLDIATLAERGQITQIILISGDSDFVPAAKHARRAGIDFVLDPLWARITDSLHEHIDGLWECVTRPPGNQSDPLNARNPDYKSASDRSDEAGELAD